MQIIWASQNFVEEWDHEDLVLSVEYWNKREQVMEEYALTEWAFWRNTMLVYPYMFP